MKNVGNESEISLIKEVKKIMKNKILIGSGILFILSLFTGSSLILTICMTMFVVSVFVYCLDLFGALNISAYLFYKSESNMIRKFINIITVPMVIIGVCMVIIDLIYMWMMALK